MSLTKATFSMIEGAFANVLDFGADPTGLTDSTTAIQTAFDQVPLGQQLYFPPGVYNVTCPAGADACLSLTRNVLLTGVGQRGAYIDGFGGTGTESVLKISIATPDARGFQMSGLVVGQGVGSNLSVGLRIDLMAATARITNCTFGGNLSNNGYAVYIDDDAFSHSELSFCTIAQGVYANCGDANVFRKNLCFGERAGFTFNIGFGIRNTLVADNTIVNRDGWVIIENGDNIRIENNQCELGPFYSPASNQNTASAGFWLKGVDRPIANCVIRKNNFGGGTNYNNSVYIENAEKTVIDDNYFVACGVASAPQYADVYCDTDAFHTYIGVNNQVLGFPVVSPRDNPFFKVRVQGGVGTFNSLQSSATLNLQNNWDGGAYYKDTSGTVRFSQPLTGLTAVAGSTIGTLPETFRPYFSSGVTQRAVLAITDAGVGYVTIDNAGVIKVGSLPGVTGVYISDFQSKAIDVV
jgi:hypothetical protein